MAETESGVAHRGPLQLSDGSAMEWENRFFVLMESSGDMLCLPSEASTLGDAEGVVNVRQMRQLRLSPRLCPGRCFEIVALDEEGHSQSCSLLAKNPEECRQWLDSIGRLCKKFGVNIALREDGPSETREEPLSTARGHNKYENEQIQCQCYFPSGDTSVTMFVRGSDFVQEVRDRLLMASDEEDHLPSEYTLKLGGMVVYLDASDASNARICDHPIIQKHIEEKKPLVLRLVLDPAVIHEDVEGPEEISDVESEIEQLRRLSLSSEDLEQYSAPLLRRMYVHVRITECWFKEGMLKDDGCQRYMNVIGSMSHMTYGYSYHGGQRLGTNLELSTGFVPQCVNPQWNEFVSFPIILFNVPEVASLNFAIYSGYQKDNQIVSKLIGWTNYHFIEDDGTVDSTARYLRLWKDEPHYSCGAVPDNLSEDYIGILCVNLDSSIYPFNLKRREDVQDEADSLFSNDPELIPSPEDRKVLAAVAAGYDVLSVPTENERLLLWRYRYAIRDEPMALARVLQAVPWHKYVYVREARKLLTIWNVMDPFTSLQLLGPQFGDPLVRSYCVTLLKSLRNEEIRSILVQLVQALQYEPRLESPLLDFLLEKASEDWSTGHYFYWHVKAGLEVPFFSVKLRFAMSKLRKKCSVKFMTALSKQEKLVLSLASIAREIREMKGKAERAQRLSTLLSKLETFEPVLLPVDPRYEVNGLEVKKCKFMDSKKLPLWLVFKNVDPTSDEHIHVIFKTGDDLRQDMLTLQMLSLMDQIWSRAGLNLKMSIYGCVATGVDSGMLQVVRNAETLSNICKVSGGGIAVFKEDTLVNWIFQHSNTFERYNEAVENFTRSCAAYCVSTCVLGIGDRHNDNIMLKRTGEFFHIDFGHVLGHFKSKFGFRRERARFVLTPDMAFVMGGPQDHRFKSFEHLCVTAFNHVRAYAALFLNLLSLMISSGLPEVSRPDDIRYMQKMLVLHLSDEDAGKEFRKWLHDSLHAKSTLLNHAIHTWVHS